MYHTICTKSTQITTKREKESERLTEKQRKVYTQNKWIEANVFEYVVMTEVNNKVNVLKILGRKQTAWIIITRSISLDLRYNWNLNQQGK